MRGQGQRLRPTAERKGSGETQPKRAGPGYDLADSVVRQSERRTPPQLRGCSQSRTRTNPRTRSRSVGEQQDAHMLLGEK